MVPNVQLKMISYFRNDAKRINHALKVYGFAKTISLSENVPEEKKVIIDYASILHDIGIVEAERKYNSSAGKYQEIEGPPVAREILEGLSLPDELIERVCFLIAHHHSYHMIDDIDLQILIEADFIVNAYEDELSFSAIENIRGKIFKTAAGKEILKTLYSR